MRNVSNVFKNELYNGNRNYVESCKITFIDGTSEDVTNANIWSGGFKIEDSVSSSGNFDIGAVIVNQFVLILNNIYDDYSEYDFDGAEISNVKAGLNLPNGTTESVSFGTYTVSEAKYNGSIITLTCVDNMSKFDRPYSDSNLTYPATLGAIVRDACNVCDVSLASNSATFENDDFVVSKRPDGDTTFREVLSWVGQISCHWLKCNVSGQLTLGWYDREFYDTIGNYDAKTFSDPASNTIDAGSFSNPATDVIDAGSFSDAKKYHHIYSTISTDMSTDDVIITGIRVSEEPPEESENQDPIIYQAGEDGYVLGVENNGLIQDGKGAEVAQYLGTRLIGLQFRPLTLTCISDPTIEAGDIALFTDRKGRTYKTLITRTTFQAKNYQTISCDAQTPKQNRASRSSKYTQVYQKLKNELSRQKSAWEMAIEDLDNRLTNSSGLYSTIEKQEDGSNIYYLHDKPTLEESEIVWKMTAEAWGVSTNGGETWNGGMTVDGDVIARILTSIGVNADWINTGALVIQDADGNIMFRADVDTGIVDIIANTLSIRGKTVEEIAQDNLSDYVNEVFDPAIDNLQAQIDGQIETWFYNYVPTTSNAPASQWVTDTEKEKHLGDLFYIVDNEEYGGQAYRWAKINNAYAWDYVEDTATTKALADAAKAQDTADSKRRVFISTPVPPYDVGDLWVGDTSSDLMRCQTARQSGTYVSTDWIKAVKYTDDSALNTFISGEYSDTIEDLQTQADQKAETWYQATDPSSVWSSTDKQNHKGDLWYNTSDQKTYIYNGSVWEETKSAPPDEVFDQIDGKAQIFISQPVPPYNQGDLWFNSASSDIMTCITSRESGSYVAADWQKRNKYVDQSTVNNAITEYDTSLGQTEVFNKLTNGGQTQGIYIQNGKLYINADYILSGTVAGQRINAKGIKVLDSNNNTTFEIDFNGNVTIRANTFSLQGSTIQNIANSAASSAANSALTSANNYTDNKASSTLSSAQSYATNQANNAYNNSKNYTDNQLANFNPDVDLTQQEIFNILTNNGQTQGIYLSGGKIYVNASYIGSGTISSDRISINDVLEIANKVGGWKISSNSIESSNGSLYLYSDGRIISWGSSSSDGYFGYDPNSGLSVGSLVVSKGSSLGSLGGTTDIYNAVLHNSATIPIISGGTTFTGDVTVSKRSLYVGNGLTVYGGGEITGGLYLYSLPPTPSASVVRVGTGGRIYQTGQSSKRYKNHVRDMDLSDAEKLYNIPVIYFTYKDGYLDKTDERHGCEMPGFYAEDMQECFPDATDHIELNGEIVPDNWNERMLIPAMMKLIQTQHEEIETLKSNQQKILQALSKAGIEVEL